MTTKKNRTITQGTDQQVIDGIKKDLQTMSSLSLGGTTYTPASLMAFIQSRIDAANGVITAKANWQNAGKTYDALSTQVDEVIRDLKALVIGAFGSESVKLADFGFKPRKVVARTPEQKAEAAAKAKATREARHTMGPKAKLAVKGAVGSTTASSTTAAPAGSTVAPATTTTAAPPAASSNQPAATPPPAPQAPQAAAPTVTVNVTTAPGTQPVASPATATPPTQTQATNGAAALQPAAPEAPANAGAKS